MVSEMFVTFIFASCIFMSKVHGEVRPQIPGVWDALDALRGRTALPVVDIQEMFYTVIPGTDFPIYSEIPETKFYCSDVHQPGYYADTEARCQVFRRCDLNGLLTSYLCPNMTLFNQITLICDWWYNVDCAQAKNFYDYSNSRLYQGEDVVLLDNQDYLSDKAIHALEAQVHVPPPQIQQVRAGAHAQPAYGQRKPKVHKKPMYQAEAEIESGMSTQDQLEASSSQIRGGGRPEGISVGGRAESRSEFREQEPEQAPIRKKKVKRTRARN